MEKIHPPPPAHTHTHKKGKRRQLQQNKWTWRLVPGFGELVVLPHVGHGGLLHGVVAGAPVRGGAAGLADQLGVLAGRTARGAWGGGGGGGGARSVKTQAGSTWFTWDLSNPIRMLFGICRVLDVPSNHSFQGSFYSRSTRPHSFQDPSF